MTRRSLSRKKHPNRKLISLFLVSGFLFLLPSLFSAPYALFPAVAQTTQNRKAEFLRLNNEGEKLRRRGQYREPLEKFQRALDALIQLCGETTQSKL